MSCPLRRFIMVLALSLAAGCAPRPAVAPAGKVASGDLEWNFVGVTAVDWPEAFQFYTEKLGVRVHSRDGHWAMFGAGWDGYRAGKSRGLVFELFEGAGGLKPGEPAICLGLPVRDLDKAVDALSARGMTLRRTKEDARVEFEAPGGTRWILRSAPEARAAVALTEPEILLAEMRVHDWRGQIGFYRDALGMRVVEVRSSGMVLSQFFGGPQLVLKPGGRKHVLDPKWVGQPALGQPIFLSFMTREVKAAAARLREAGVRTLRGVEHHDWGGADLIVADADGNAVQVVQYDDPPRFGGTPRSILNAAILENLGEKVAHQFGAKPSAWKLKTKHRYVESNKVDLQLASTNEELMVVVQINSTVVETIAQFDRLAMFAANRQYCSDIGDAAFLVNAASDKFCVMNVRMQNALVSVGGGSKALCHEAASDLLKILATSDNRPVP